MRFLHANTSCISLYVYIIHTKTITLHGKPAVGFNIVIHLLSVIFIFIEMKYTWFVRDKRRLVGGFE